MSVDWVSWRTLVCASTLFEAKKGLDCAGELVVGWGLKMQDMVLFFLLSRFPFFYSLLYPRTAYRPSIYTGNTCNQIQIHKLVVLCEVETIHRNPS